MKKTLSILFVSALCFSSVPLSAYADAVSSKDMAIKYAKQLADGEQQYKYYISKTTLKDTIAYGKTLKGEYWLVFVDEKPGANWEHPCKYIFVNTNGNDEQNYIIDAVMPPHNIELTEYGKPAKVSRASDDDFLNYPIIPSNYGKIAESSPHTYALIISGGSYPRTNETKYWNDCAFIYNTLTRSYGVPKSNIQVLMSDGTDPAKDLNIGDFSEPEYISSPLDLDGDGSPEIDYPATKEYLKTAVDGFANRLTDEDHLFVFVTDHGGGNKNAEPYICFWNRENIMASDFNDYFKDINAGYVSFVLGQCSSGGFTKYLHADNRIVLTASGEGEYSYGGNYNPYDEFLFHLTTFLNGYDPYGNKVKSSDIPTMQEAFEYAVANDVYANGKSPWTETPTKSLLENSTAEELTLATVPPVVDICIDNSENDKFSDSPNLKVTLLNADEEKVTAFNCDPQSNIPYKANAELRLYNRGVKEYKGNGASLSLYGCKASLIASPEDVALSEDKVLSVTEPLTETIKPGEHVSKNILCNLKNRSQYPVGRTNYVAVVDDDINTEKWNKATKGIFSKTVSQNMFEIKFGNDNTIAISSPEMIGNGKSYSIVIEEDANNEKSLFDVADLNIFCGNNDYNIKNLDTVLPDEINDKFVKKGIKINGNAEISNVRFEESDSSTLSLECNFHAQKKITTESPYRFCVSMYDEETGDCLGEQTFTAMRSPRKAINISVDDIKAGDTDHYLQVSSASEKNLEFLWFNESGKYVGEGNKVRAPYSGKNEMFTAVAKSMSDGCVTTAECMASFYSMIRAISKDASRQLCTLDFRAPTDRPYTMMVTPAGVASQTETYTIPQGSRTFSFHYSGFGSRLYILSISYNGKMLESHKINL